ncbi:MAG: DUF2815 family protein [Synergistaceae bacterium]|nr:DUF2815 family protein [Synergistaceae bacterium]
MVEVNSKELLSKRRVSINGWLCGTNLVEPEKSFEVSKYTVNIAFPSADEATYLEIQTAMRNAFNMKREELFVNGVEAKFEDAITPIRYDDEFEGLCFLRATRRSKPNPTDNDYKNINLASEPVWGAEGNISVLFRCCKINGIIRIFATLDNVQIISNKNHLEELLSFSPKEDFEKFSGNNEASHKEIG